MQTVTTAQWHQLAASVWFVSKQLQQQMVHQEIVLRKRDSTGIAPPILNFRTRLEVSCHLHAQTILPPRTDSQYPLNKRIRAPKISLASARNPSASNPAHTTVTILTMLPQLALK
jgi:hypothetical protein